MKRDYPEDKLYSNGDLREKYKMLALSELRRLGYTKDNKVSRETWHKLQNEKLYRLARIIDKEGLVDFNGAYIKQSSEKLHTNEKGKIILPEKKGTIFDY